MSRSEGSRAKRLSSLYNAFMRGGTFIAPVEDEGGTIIVKRYRSVVPGAGR